MGKIFKHLSFDIALWFGMYLMFTENPYSSYAYNAIVFVYGVKAIISLLLLMLLNHIKVKKVPSKMYFRYMSVTVFVETLAFAIFGFYWLAISSAFSWFIINMIFTNEMEKQNAKQG